MKNEELHEIKQKNKQLLALEWVIGFLGLAVLFAMVVPAAIIAETYPILATIMIILSFTIMMVAFFSALKIEQIAGNYRCAKCGHKHIPTFGAVFVAMHFGRTRHLRCPKCGEKSWQKKVL